MNVGIYSVSVIVCQDAPAWCIMYLSGLKGPSYMFVLTGPPLGYFVHFSRLLSLITQIQPEEWFSSHEIDLEGCGALRVLSTTWFVMCI